MTVCKNCHTFKTVGKKCWYFWEKKKTCSQFKKHSNSEPGFNTIIEEF